MKIPAFLAEKPAIKSLGITKPYYPCEDGFPFSTSPKKLLITHQSLLTLHANAMRVVG